MIAKKDNTEVKIKEKINPVKREFPYKEFSFTYGKKFTREELEASNLKLEYLGLILKELKDLELGLETISAALDYTTPSYWINRNGGDLNTAEALGIDLLTYIALGGLDGLVKQGAVKLTKTGIQKTAKFATTSARATVSNEAKSLRGTWNPEFKLNTGKPIGHVDYESKVIPVRDRLIEWYSSPDYKQRLKQVGLSDAQADERILQLIANTHVKVSDGRLNPTEYGLTSIDLKNLTPIRITVDASLLANDVDFNSTVLEELLHASEFNGLTVLDLVQDPVFLSLPKNLLNLLLNNVTKLHNDVAYTYNASAKPKDFNWNGIELVVVESSPNPDLALNILNQMSYRDKQNALVNAANYYNLTHESRARAIGSILNDSRMSTEWDLVWLNTPLKEVFRKSVLAVPLITTQQEKQGGKMNYIDYFKKGSDIHIKKSHEGKFSSYCGGKVTDECIEKGKHSTSAAVRKRAVFAENARKWKR